MQVSPHTAQAAIRHREASAGEKQPSPTSRYGFVSGLRFPVRSAVTCRHEGPVSVRAACGKTFPHLSRDPPPVGSLRPFGLRHEPLSASLQCGVGFLRHPLPAFPSYTLRFPASQRRRNTGLPCSADLISDDLGPANPPGESQAVRNESGALRPYPSPFGPSLSAPLACLR